MKKVIIKNYLIKFSVIFYLLICGCASYQHLGVNYSEGSNQFIEKTEYSDGKIVYEKDGQQLSGEFEGKEYIEMTWREFWEWANSIK